MVSLSQDWRRRLKVPVIAAPMFLASGPELVLACCRAGVVGAFPAGNARPAEELERWLDRLREELGEDDAPFAVNYTLGRSLDENPLAQVAFRRRPPMVITSIGDPTEMVRRVHDWGGLVFHDVTTLRHAEKAIAAGVDGVILVCAGAGGHAGALNPFALLPQVRRRFGGLIVLGGAIGDGRGVLAAQALGADLVYMGTRFLATEESLVPAGYKALVLEAQTQDVIYTPSISGLPASFLRQSIEGAGLDPARLPPPLGVHRADLPEGVRAWRDIWSAGQGVGCIDDIPSAAVLIDRIAAEYGAARATLAADLARERT